MGVCADLTVTASWDCIAEILDLTPDIPHARGFNATERSGAVTVAAAMAAYTQLGILAFAIYGHDVQNADDALTDDVSARILSFGRAALAVGLMRVRSYLGMRSQYIDMVELGRRITAGIYDHVEWKWAMAWVSASVRTEIRLTSSTAMLTSVNSWSIRSRWCWLPETS